MRKVDTEVEVAGAVRTELAAELARIDANVSSVSTGGGASVSEIEAAVVDDIPTPVEIAQSILANPAYKIATDSEGRVMTTSEDIVIPPPENPRMFLILWGNT